MSFPFAALVGQEQLRLALLLNAVCPAIGGVLIRGEKGTAKSTAARALADLLPPMRAIPGCPFRCDPAEPWRDCPHCPSQDGGAVEIGVPFVELPLGATEDRVLGSIDLERALREGRRALQPGLLATVHRGVLYVDEVNLLADHLVDVLLDSAASGVNTIEREGISVRHPSRFILVGTMNPEEGDLRPQLLDRFGLMVTAATPRDPADRAEIVRRRLAFDASPDAFAQQWGDEQNRLRQQVVQARDLLPSVVLADGLALFIARLCAEMEVDGLRGDLVLHRASRALAALRGRREVIPDDIRVVAELALPHRRRRKPFEQPELPQQKLDELFQEPTPQSATDTGASEGHDGGNREEEEVFAPAPFGAPLGIDVASPASSSGSRGRRNAAQGDRQGQYVRARPDAQAKDIAVDATVRSAAARGGYRDGKLQVEPSDVHAKERVGRAGTLILFVADASGSMAAEGRMAAVKGAILALLQSAYEERDQVAVIAFRGGQAELLLPPTGSVELAERALRALPTGGRTPLAHALVLAGQVLARRGQQPGLRQLLVLLTDGKANAELPDASGDPWQQTLQAAGALAARGVAGLVLDTEAGFVRVGRAALLATALGAECLPLDRLSADQLALTIRQRVRGGRA